MDRQQDRGSGEQVIATPRWRAALHRAVQVVFPPGLPWWKRMLDLGIIFFLSWLIVPLCALIALLIKTGSKGPVLFRQERIGYKASHFTCLKFRTMTMDAEIKSHKDYAQRLIKSQGPMTKLDNGNDPRVIPHGRFLRATGLDELPQLLNVLRGEMSFVGPRPCLPYELAAYEPWHCRRFQAVPGLTGLWQVNGKNQTSFEEMIKLDISYSLKQSLWLDLYIILKTPTVILTQFLELRAAKRVEKAASTKESRPALAALLERILSFRL